MAFSLLNSILPLILLVTIINFNRSCVDSVVIRVENLPERCDFRKCFKWDPEKINVHIVSHSHDDVGWLKTPEQYYYGLRNDIQKASVNDIIETAVDELVRNKDRRFVQVETAFFWHWWTQQDDNTKQVVNELVQTGQLEFANGAWSMPDEATTHYNSLIDQSTWGLRRLNDSFGKCGQPRATWQIDPFGHSKELASLFAQMNYDAVFFARQDFQDRQHRIDTHTLEHVWEGSEDLGSEADIFTGMMANGYGPIEFNWDMVGGSETAIVDDPESIEYNVPNFIDRLEKAAKSFAEKYLTKNIMFPMGTDFQYQAAHDWFKNLDKLIKAVNENSKEVRIFYSTPMCYAKSLHESNVTWTTKTDDFFPYASSPEAFWTGYFTSRPALKRMERMANNLLQACKQLDVFANEDDSLEHNITRLREAMGVMQHHDAVSGTEKQHVANEYARMLDDAMKQCQHVIDVSYQKLLGRNGGKSNPQQFCPYLNISSCQATESGKPMEIFIYNPLGHDLNDYTIRLPINENYYYTVHDPNGKLVNAVIVPVPKYIQNVPLRETNATKDLVFKVSVKALSLSIYKLIPSKEKTSDSAKDAKKVVIDKPMTFQIKNMQVKFDSNGMISSIVKNGEEIQLKSEFRYYSAYSGAYKLNPKVEEAHLIEKDFKNAKFQSILYVDEENDLVQEVHQSYDNEESYIGQIIQLSKDKEYLDFNFWIGNIPMDDHVDPSGKEILARYITNLDSNKTFLTDANGRQLLERRWDYRPTWDFETTQEIAGNFYPVVSRIALVDSKKNVQMTILTDRSQSGSLSYKLNGSLDLLVHRRLPGDDSFGVGEALNERMTPTRGLEIVGHHLVLFDEPKMAAMKHRPLAQEIFMAPIISFSESSTQSIRSFDFINQKQPQEYQAMNDQLPENVHLLTLERWHSNGYLIRLENIFQTNENPKIKTEVVSLKNLFKNFQITTVKELTLGANQIIEQMNDRLVFQYQKDSNNEILKTDPIWRKNHPEIDDDNLQIQLKPMQIRTFFVQISRK